VAGSSSPPTRLLRNRRKRLSSSFSENQTTKTKKKRIANLHLDFSTLNCGNANLPFEGKKINRKNDTTDAPLAHLRVQLLILVNVGTDSAVHICVAPTARMDADGDAT
jgi:hypothetical protein